MKINTLRRIDYLIGRPACWILTSVYQLKKLFVEKKEIKHTNKILLIKLFGMGSIVLAIPSIHAIKKKYKHSSVYFLTFKENAEILHLTGILPPQNIHTVRQDKVLYFFIDVIRSFLVFIKESIDVVVDLEFFSRFTAIFSFLIRSKYRIGFYGFYTEGLRRGSFIDFKINYNHTLHTSRAFFTLLKPLHIGREAYDPSLPDVSPSAGFKENVYSLIQQANRSCSPEKIDPWILVNPNSSDLISLRKWPETHYSELIRLFLGRSPSAGIILLGAKNERPAVTALQKDFSSPQDISRIVNLAGMTKIRDLVDLFHFSSLLISNDSGVAHIASLTDISSIVLFGPETPDLYSPLGIRSRCIYLGLDCQPCITVYNGKKSYCRNNVCLKQIDPGFVFKLSEEMLSNRDTTGSHLSREHSSRPEAYQG